eukprot:tig00000821_g4527.t1
MRTRAAAGLAALALVLLLAAGIGATDAAEVPGIVQSVQAALRTTQESSAEEQHASDPAQAAPQEPTAPDLGGGGTQEEQAALQQQRALYEAAAHAAQAALERALQRPDFNVSVCGDEPGFQGAGLVVRRATYGMLDAGRFVGDADAREALQRHAGEAGLFLAGDPFWMDSLFGDPYPGLPKLLEVEYSRPPGKRCSIVVPHSVPALELPCYDPEGPLPTPAGPPPGDPKLRPDVVIVSAPREGPYVHETIASLLLAGVLGAAPHINVFVGANETSYLKNYSHHRRLRIHRLSQADWDAVRERDRRIRHLMAYRRALEVPLVAPDGLIVLEDDVKVEDDFLRVLGLAVREIEAKHECYMLVLYSNRLWQQLRTRDFHAGGRWRPIPRYIEYKPDPGAAAAPPAAAFLSRAAAGRAAAAAGAALPAAECPAWALAMYYPRCALRPLVELGFSLLQHPDDSPYFARWYYDSVVTFYSDRHSVPLLVLPQSPVQHFGRASALSLGWHESPTWDPA